MFSITKKNPEQTTPPNPIMEAIKKFNPMLKMMGVDLDALVLKIAGFLHEGEKSIDGQIGYMITPTNEGTALTVIAFDIKDGRELKEIYRFTASTLQEVTAELSTMKLMFDMFIQEKNKPQNELPASTTHTGAELTSVTVSEPTATEPTATEPTTAQ